MTKPVVLQQKWTCETCGARGYVEHLSTEDAKAVWDEAMEQHAIQRPDCATAIRFSGAGERLETAGA